MTAPGPLPSDLAAAHAMILAERSARLPPRPRRRRRSVEAASRSGDGATEAGDRAAQAPSLWHAFGARHPAGTAGAGALELEETVAAADAARALRAAERLTPEQPAARHRASRRGGRCRHACRVPGSSTRRRPPVPAVVAPFGKLRRGDHREPRTLAGAVVRRPACAREVSCRCCEAINEAPAPFHPIARGRAGPDLLAEVMFGKYGLHLPLNRQSACFAREGIELDVSTLADWVGTVAASLQPLTDAIAPPCSGGLRLHADETTVPVLAKGKAGTAGCGRSSATTVRSADPETAGSRLFLLPRPRGVHPRRSTWPHRHPAGRHVRGIGHLYGLTASGPIIEAACWSHARRGVLRARGARRRRRSRSKRCAGSTRCSRSNASQRPRPSRRLAVRPDRSRPLVVDFAAWMRGRVRAQLSASRGARRSADADCMLKRSPTFVRFLDDGDHLPDRSDAAERAAARHRRRRTQLVVRRLRRGRPAAAAMYTLIERPSFDDIDPRAPGWPTSSHASQATPAKRIDELLPWNWQKRQPLSAAA